MSESNLIPFRLTSAELRLIEAAGAGDLDGVRAWLGHGASPDTRDDWAGWPVILRAAHGGYEAVVDVLVKAGANVNAQAPAGLNALMGAVAGTHVGTVSRLLAESPDLAAVRKDGHNALTLATSLDIAALLLDAGHPIGPDIPVYSARINLLQACFREDHAALAAALQRRGLGDELRDHAAKLSPKVLAAIGMEIAKMSAPPVADDERDRRSERASQIFEHYEFPANVDSLEHSGWESDGETWTRVVFVEYEESRGSEVPSSKLTFRVVFDRDGEVATAGATDANGATVGERADPVPVRWGFK